MAGKPQVRLAMPKAFPIAPSVPPVSPRMSKSSPVKKKKPLTYNEFRKTDPYYGRYGELDEEAPSQQVGFEFKKQKPPGDRSEMVNDPNKIADKEQRLKSKFALLNAPDKMLTGKQAQARDQIVAGAIQSDSKKGMIAAATVKKTGKKGV